MLDFRRIAILEPSLVFPRPLSAMSEKEIISHARQWAEVTLNNGADAWYLRFHRDYEFIPLIQTALDSYKGVNHLVPYPARNKARPSDGIHFRKTDDVFGDAPIDKNPGPQGLPCHTFEELISADETGLDYAFYSPIFKTQTHPEAKPVGLEALKKACSETSIPIFALGGISQENEKACLDAGAFGIAGIRMFL